MVGWTIRWKWKPDKMLAGTPALSRFFYSPGRCFIMIKEQNFTKGPIFGPLVRFALPILAALFLQAMYGAVDMMVVGQFATAADVSAVSTASWLMYLVTALVVGVAVGTTVLLGNKLGEGDTESCGKIIGASIALFGIMALILTVVMELLSTTLVRIMQTPPEAVNAAVAYMRICSAGTVFIIAYNVLGSVFRGIGNSRIPLMAVGFACVFNIAGDYLLVGVFKMAAAGAAIATVAAQALSVVLSLCIIRRQKLPFTFQPSDIRADWQRMGAVLRIGFPIALQDVLVSISFLAITAIVNSLGVIISAGVGVAEKLCGFIMLVPSAFGQAMSSYVAQNVGAKEFKRATRGLMYGIGASFAVGIAIGYFSFFHGDIMAGLFVSGRDPAVIAAAAEYLKAYAIDCLFVSFLFCMTGYFNGMGKTRFVMVQGIVGAFCVRVPVSYLMSKVEPVSLFRIGAATPCSTLVQITLCGIYFLLLSRAEKKNSWKQQA